MNLNSNLFISMLGDYYIHTSSLLNQNIFTNNRVSLTIERAIGEMSNSILSDFLSYNTKTRLYLGFFKLNIKNEISFFNIVGNEIEPNSYISPFDEKIYNDKNKLIQQATTHRVKQGLLYYFIKKPDNIFFDDFLDSLNKDDIIKAIIQKFLYLSPENYDVLQKLISILMGAPVSLAEDGETILNNSSEIIITDKNTYKVKQENIFYRQQGEKVNFLEPIFYLCKISPTDIYSDDIYLKLMKKKKQDDFYATQLIESLYGSYLYFSIHIESFINNSFLVSQLNSLNTKLKIIQIKANTRIEEKASYDCYNKFTLYAEKTKVYIDMKEDVSITTSFFKHKNTFLSTESNVSKIKYTNNINYNSLDTLKGYKIYINFINTIQNNKNIYQKNELISSTEYHVSSSKLNNYIISNVKTKNNEKIFFNSDLNLFNSNLKTKITSQIKANILIPNEIYFHQFNIDNMMSQIDSIKNILDSKSQITQQELNIKTSKLTREDTGYTINDKKLNIIKPSLNVLNKYEKFNRFTIDKLKIKLYNKSNLSTKHIALDIQKLKDNGIYRKIHSELIENKDSMEVESNINIDKE